MGIPVLLDFGDKIKRTGAFFHAPCPNCGASAKMFEVVKNFNVSLFFAISLWDDEEPGVQCGDCLGVFVGEAAESVRATAQDKPGLLERVTSKLRSTPPPAPAPERKAPAPSTPPARRAPIDEAAIDAELAAMKKRLGK